MCVFNLSQYFLQVDACSNVPFFGSLDKSIILRHFFISCIILIFVHSLSGEKPLKYHALCALIQEKLLKFYYLNEYFREY